MGRRAVVVAVWVVGTLASLALAWTAVSAVGGQVSDRPAGDLTASQVAEVVARPRPSTTTDTTLPAPATGRPVAEAAAPSAPGTGPPGTEPSTPPPPPTTPPTSSQPAPPESAPASTGPAATSATATATATAASGLATTRTLDSAGGSVGVTCTGDRVRLDFATPRAGYATELNDVGPQKIDVRFENDDGDHRVVVTCTDGTPDVEIREQ